MRKSKAGHQYQSQVHIATNKERIEKLEAGFGELQDSFNNMEIGITGKLQQMEDSIQKITEALFSNRDSSNNLNNRNNRSYTNKEESRDSFDGGWPLFSSQLAKLEFPRFSGGDPTEWFTKVEQFFEYQAIADTQKVALASFHLEGKANHWLQWLRKTFKEECKDVTWNVFHEELWARFGPTKCENFDEALSRVRQTGSLRDYQSEFERLGNRVQGWTPKALVGTFMGGLKPEIADGIRMFKPNSLNEAISLAMMRDEQLVCQRKDTRPFNQSMTDFSSPKIQAASPIKHLTWDEMQKRRTRGLF